MEYFNATRKFVRIFNKIKKEKKKPEEQNSLLNFMLEYLKVRIFIMALEIILC